MAEAPSAIVDKTLQPLRPEQDSPHSGQFFSRRSQCAQHHPCNSFRLSIITVAGGEDSIEHVVYPFVLCFALYVAVRIRNLDILIESNLVEKYEIQTFTKQPTLFNATRSRLTTTTLFAYLCLQPYLYLANRCAPRLSLAINNIAP